MNDGDAVRGPPLDVVVEGAQVVAVAIQQAAGVVVGEVPESQEGVVSPDVEEDRRATGVDTGAGRVEPHTELQSG